MPDILERLCAERLDVDRRGRARGPRAPIFRAGLGHVARARHGHRRSRRRADARPLVRGARRRASRTTRTIRPRPTIATRSARDIEATVRPRFAERLAAPDRRPYLAPRRGDRRTARGADAFAMPSFKLVLLGGLQEPAHGGRRSPPASSPTPDQLPGRPCTTRTSSRPPSRKGCAGPRRSGTCCGASRPGRRLGGVDVPRRRAGDPRRLVGEPRPRGLGSDAPTASTSSARGAPTCHSRPGRTTASVTISPASSSRSRSPRSLRAVPAAAPRPRSRGRLPRPRVPLPEGRPRPRRLDAVGSGTVARRRPRGCR